MIRWLRNNKITSTIIGALIAIIGFLGGEGVLGLYDRTVASIEAPNIEAREAIHRFIAVNNNEEYTSYALNSPIEGDTLFVRWFWGKHTGGAYCYYYTIDGNGDNNTYYHARVAGKCNPEGFSLANKPEGFHFDSSIGVKLPFNIPPGEYTLTYYHLEEDGYHDKHQIWVNFKPIPFEVKEYK